MKKITIWISLLFPCLLILGCDTNYSDSFGSCNKDVAVSEKEYTDAPRDPMVISSIEIRGDCIKFNFSALGCDGQSWKVKLIRSELTLLSNPPQTSVRLSLENKEKCGNLVTKEAYFDLVNVLFGDGKRMVLKIANWDHDILYESR